MKKVEQELEAYTDKNIYDFDNKLMINYYPVRIMEILKENNKTYSSILECGIGHGYSTKVFNKYFARHVVLDADKIFINHFQRENPECSAEIIETFFEEYNTEEKFDVIVMGFILEHVEDPVMILKRFKQFLSKDGTIFVTVPNAETLNKRVGKLAGLLPDFYQLSKNDVEVGHRRYYNTKSLQNNFEKAGYTTKRMEGLFLKPITTQQFLDLNLTDEILEAFCKVGRNYPELSLGILAEIL